MGRAASLAAVAFVLVASAVSPAWAWLDSGEIAAAGAELGVMHPTGTPGLTAFLQLACALPLGSLGFRMALVSAGFAAGAIAMLVRIVERRGGGWGSCALVSVWLLAGLTFSRQARVVEIYSYGAFLLMVVLDAFDPRGEATPARRLVGTAAAVLGVWGFGDLRLALALPVALGWAWAMKSRKPWALHAPWVVVAASVVVLSMSLASSRAPLADWGDPDGWRRLWQQLDASSIRAAFGGEILPGRVAPWALESGRAFDRLVEDLGPLGPLAALAGGVLLWRRPEERSWLYALIGLVLVEWIYIVGINPMGGADRQTGIPLALVAATIVGCALAPIEAEAGRMRWPLLLGLGAALCIAPVLRSWPDLGATRSWGPHAWSRRAWAKLAPGRYALTVSDDLAAGWRASTSLEGARPDLFVYPAQHLYRPAPDWVLARRGDARRPLEQAWAACGEGARALAYAAALEAAGGRLLVENPGREMVAALPATLDGPLPWGEVVLRGATEPATPARFSAAVDLALREGLDAHGGLEAPEDRRRLLIAVSARLRAWLSARSFEPAALEVAVAAYREAMARTGVESAATWVSLGALLDRKGDRAAAIRATRRALALEPGRRLALTNLALYLADDPASLAEARALAEQATELHADTPGSWRRLASVCRIAGDAACTERAERGLEAAEVARAAAQAQAPGGASRPGCPGAPSELD